MEDSFLFHGMVYQNYPFKGLLIHQLSGIKDVASGTPHTFFFNKRGDALLKIHGYKFIKHPSPYRRPRRISSRATLITRQLVSSLLRHNHGRSLRRSRRV